MWNLWGKVRVSECDMSREERVNCVSLVSFTVSWTEQRSFQPHFLLKSLLIIIAHLPPRLLCSETSAPSHQPIDRFTDNISQPLKTLLAFVEKRGLEGGDDTVSWMAVCFEQIFIITEQMLAGNQCNFPSCYQSLLLITVQRSLLMHPWFKMILLKTGGCWFAGEESWTEPVQEPELIWYFHMIMNKASCTKTFSPVWCGRTYLESQSNSSGVN